MAIQTLLTNQFRPFQDTGISESIGRGLEALTQHKMQKMQQEKTAQALQSLGLSPQLAGLDPRILQQVVSQKLQEPSQMAFAQGLQALLGGSPSPTIPTTAQQMVMEHQPSITPQKVSEGELLGRKIFGQPPMTEGERLGQVIFGNKPPAIPRPQVVSQQMPPQQQATMPVIPAGLKEQQALQLAQLGLQKQNLMRKEQIKEQQLNRQEEAKLKSQADKETAAYYNKVLDEDKSAQKIDLDTKRMIKLIEKGNLPSPLLYKFIKDAEEHGGTKVGATLGGSIGSKFGIPGSIAGAAIG